MRDKTQRNHRGHLIKLVSYYIFILLTLIKNTSIVQYKFRFSSYPSSRRCAGNSFSCRRESPS